MVCCKSNTLFHLLICLFVFVLPPPTPSAFYSKFLFKKNNNKKRKRNASCPTCYGPVQQNTISSTDSLRCFPVSSCRNGGRQVHGVHLELKRSRLPTNNDESLRLSSDGARCRTTRSPCFPAKEAVLRVHPEASHLERSVVINNDRTKTERADDAAQALCGSGKPLHEQFVRERSSTVVSAR